MWYRMSGNGNIICKKCNMVLSIVVKSDLFCPNCHYGIEEVKEALKKVEWRMTDLTNP